MPTEVELRKFCKRKYEDIPDIYKCCIGARNKCKSYLEGIVDVSVLYITECSCMYCATYWGEVKGYKVVELDGMPVSDFNVANVEAIELGEGAICGNL